jgi:eukaryotic-like serine/threonine-protein kinase
MGEKQKYRVLERIDVGGMAEVFRGLAIGVEGIEKEVAIKRILPSLTQKKRFREMFLDEARLSMRLSHANIVQVFDVGRSAGTYFIVMEFVDGVNLRRVFQRSSERGVRVPLKVACYIMAEVCKGLAHAHDLKGPDGKPLGIVHRDLSPPNVLISRAGEVRIVDFGLAKAVTHAVVTDPGIIKGKFSYLSPEAAEGKDVDHRADIFSAGIVLYELLSNRQLFRGKNDIETIELVRRAEIQPISKLNPDVPPAFERIVEKALQRDLNKRYSSARAFGDDLSAFLFENNLRVTSYDVQDTIRKLFDAEPEVAEAGGDQRHRIVDLIEEEILNLSMMEHWAELASEGSTPLDLDTLRIDSRPQHDLSDLWEVPIIPVKPLTAPTTTRGSGKFTTMPRDEAQPVARPAPQETLKPRPSGALNEASDLSQPTTATGNSQLFLYAGLAAVAAATVIVLLFVLGVV